MVPQEYIKEQMPEIIFQITKNNKITESDAKRIIQKVQNILEEVAKTKKHRGLTERVIKESVVRYNFPEKQIILHWLIKALDLDEHYEYAYNVIAMMINRQEEQDFYPIKISETKDLSAVNIHVEGLHKFDEISVEQILVNNFQLSFENAKMIKENLMGANHSLFFTYTGQKQKLWKVLGQLRKFDLSRRQIAVVFSKYCSWRCNLTTSSLAIQEDDIYRHLKEQE